MSAVKLQPGERVDLTIRGAEVVEASGPHWHFKVGTNELYIAAELLPSITVTRVAPAEWPPQPDDVWDDAHGGSWWCQPRDGEVYLQSQKGGVDDPAWVLRTYGPVTLAYRKGWTAPAADVDQADEAERDKRAAQIAGLRALADFIEAHPELPTSQSGTFVVQHFVHEDDTEARHVELERIAGVLGVDPDPREKPALPYKDHRHARKGFGGGVTYEAVFCNAYPAATDVAPSPEEMAGPVAAGPATAPEFNLGPVPHERCPHPGKRHQRHTVTDGQGAFDCPGRREPLTDEQIDGAVIALAGALDASPELLDDAPAVETDVDLLDPGEVAPVVDGADDTTGGEPR